MPLTYRDLKDGAERSGWPDLDEAEALLIALDDDFLATTAKASKS